MNADQHLYKKIKCEIDRRVETEEWPANFQIPSEGDLAAEFEVSQLTVRRALRELQTAGVLIRVQGRGTFVLGPRIQCAVFNLSNISDEITSSGGAHTCQVLAHTTLAQDNPARNILQLPGDAVVYYSRFLHLEDGTPIQIEERYVNAAEAPGYLDQTFSVQGPEVWFRRETVVNTVENTIRAIRTEDDIRRLLQIDANHPCLLLDRSTWRDGIPVTRSRFIYPGDRYRLRSTHDARTTRVALTPNLGRAR
ncbi:UTRA domain protein (plasmid) [Ochrobactrum quorumnocens]|uniref:UTRA domain protein n=1 Tax=Ochrobactrum quorumnocens TaxID=271865 RepID=A0A248UN95_9HYPH|nr:UTRA domain-containing protein [[Ochrobactrum] quorumnocens]ASV88124.1 UTRA domain protein [[Ochrobactrum] quorumnocens]